MLGMVRVCGMGRVFVWTKGLNEEDLSGQVSLYAFKRHKVGQASCLSPGFSPVLLDF